MKDFLLDFWHRFKEFGGVLLFFILLIGLVFVGLFAIVTLGEWMVTQMPWPLAIVIYMVVAFLLLVLCQAWLDSRYRQGKKWPRYRMGMRD